MDLSRNDKCPCGSGKKFKRCYSEENSGCVLFLKEMKDKMLNDHNENEKKVFRFFNETIEDIGSVFVIKKETGNSYVSQRVQIISVFTFIDVTAHYWFEYLGRKDGTPKIRFLDWTNNYCFTDKNPNYFDEFKMMGSDKLYSLRNSLVHFFGLGESDPMYQFALVPNNATGEKVEEWRKGFKNRGHNVILFRPKTFYDFIIEGALLMLEDMRANIDASGIDENKKWKHIEGINRIFQKIMKEGAVKVPLPKEDK